MGDRGLAVVGHDDALASGQAVVLDDVRRAELVERGLGLGAGLADQGASGGDAGGCHHLLGEGLGALEPRGLAGRAEAGDAARPDGVGDALDERCLRSDDDQVGAQPLGQSRDVVARHRVDRVEGGDGGDAGVAGGGVDLGDAGVQGQGAGERVLTSAGADHEGLHGRPA